MTPSVRTLKGSKTKGFQGSTPLCPRGSNARGFSSRFRNKILDILVSLKMVSPLYQDNPRHPQQKYVLTEKGADWLRKLEEANEEAGNQAS